MVVRFFGYAHSRPSGPTNHDEMAQVQHTRAATATNWQAIFITFDPERDNPPDNERRLKPTFKPSPRLQFIALIPDA